MKKKVSLFHKITKQHNCFNIDNNKKYFLITKSVKHRLGA